MTRLNFAVLTELEIMSCCTLTSWDFGNLGFHVGPKSAVRVPLHGLHLAQPALVAFEHFRLIRNRDLGIDDEREIETDQFSQDSGERGIREFFQTYKGIEDSADIQIGVRLICDACVDDLLAGAPVFQLILTPPVRPMESADKGLRARFASRNNSSSVSRRAPSSAASSVVSRPRSRLSNSASNC